jgi:hypothetical protein
VSEEAGLDGLIGAAVARRPDAAVFILPRGDGQYSNHATDTIALLEEAGVAVDYATDPMASGVHGEKAADVVLPTLLIVLGDAAAYAGAVEGVAWVLRWFTSQMPLRKVAVDVLLQRGADGSSRRRVKLDNVTADEAIKLLKAAGKLEPPK